MKHFQSKRFASKFSLSFAMLILLSANTANAMMMLNVKCPKSFIGTVTKVVNSKAPLFSQQALGQLKKIDVHFQVEEVLRGEFNDELMIQTLKNGPVVFQEGEQYEVDMRANYICKAKQVGQ